MPTVVAPRCFFSANTYVLDGCVDLRSGSGSVDNVELRRYCGNVRKCVDVLLVSSCARGAVLLDIAANARSERATFEESGSMREEHVSSPP